MDQNTSTILVALFTAFMGAIVGGGAVLVVVDRLINNALNSPVILQSIQALAQSWPAPVRDTLHDAATLVEKVTDAPVTTTATPAAQ